MASKHDRAREAWMVLNDLFLAERHHERLSRVASEVELTTGQLHLLLHLTRDGDGRPMRALTGVMRCDASYVTTTVDALVRRGYVERRVSVVDRRVKLVFVTEGGHGVVARAVELLSVPPDSFERLTLADLEALRTLLAKLAGDSP
jgi:DNA-binding MarR family transcriptional regulator